MPWPTKRKRKFGVRGEKVETAPRKSWLPGQKGQGGEGLSSGYGGSAGGGDGASGPQSVPRDDDEREASDERSNPSLPSRSHIARVLR